MGFGSEEVRALIGARVRPRLDPEPAASCGRVVGAEPVGGAWVLLVAGRIRGAEVLLQVSREDLRLLEVCPWNA